MINNIEKYMNLVELLKQALLFYGKKENYVKHESKKALINIDNGHQANFALNKIDEIEEALNGAEINYEETIEESTIIASKILQTISEIKNIGK